MPSLQHRAPRLDLSFPLEFRAGPQPVSGHCLNISESGLLAVFNEPLDLWTSGQLLLQAGEVVCRLEARVARVADNEAGLAFAFRDEAERRCVGELLTIASSKTHLVGPPPF